MATFTEHNFYRIIKEIESMEITGDNIDVPIGILEIMYDDYSGWIAKYFDTERCKRNKKELWGHLTNDVLIRRTNDALPKDMIELLKDIHFSNSPNPYKPDYT